MLGLDNDFDSARTFTTNFPMAEFIGLDIREVGTESIGSVVANCGADPKLFCGCAPCQAFSKQSKNKSGRANDVYLLTEFQRFVVRYLPEYILIENVRGVQQITEDGPFIRFIEVLARLGYHFEYGIVNFRSLGVPQRRHRLILIGSFAPGLHIPPPTHGPATENVRYSTVYEWIHDLPPLQAGEAHRDIPNHVASNLSPLNLQRIMATPINGDRRQWPDDLILDCHRGDYLGHTDVYGRLRWDDSAGSLTTRCNSLSNGRFGHPEQHRAISIREAASLQTFPRDFEFAGSIQSCARQIGNAVPVLGSRRLGEAIIRHFDPRQEDLYGDV